MQQNCGILWIVILNFIIKGHASFSLNIALLIYIFKIILRPFKRCSLILYGKVVIWFYLTGRIQRVVIEDAVSGDQELGFGVPQGSVLGPKIYCMYTKPVSDIIQRHGLYHHCYADDTQLYMTMDHSNNNWRDGLARIQLCVSEIREWMNQNMLKLNDDKTELIVFTSKYKQDLYNDLSITIGDTVVDCGSQVKDLGVIFDQVLSLRQHVSYTSKTCRFHLRNISMVHTGQGKVRENCISSGSRKNQGILKLVREF